MDKLLYYILFFSYISQLNAENIRLNPEQAAALVQVQWHEFQGSPIPVTAIQLSNHSGLSLNKLFFSSDMDEEDAESVLKHLLQKLVLESDYFIENKKIAHSNGTQIYFELLELNLLKQTNQKHKNGLSVMGKKFANVVRAVELQIKVSIINNVDQDGDFYITTQLNSCWQYPQAISLFFVQNNYHSAITDLSNNIYGKALIASVRKSLLQYLHHKTQNYLHGKIISYQLGDVKVNFTENDVAVGDELLVSRRDRGFIQTNHLGSLTVTQVTKKYALARPEVIHPDALIVGDGVTTIKKQKNSLIYSSAKPMNICTMKVGQFSADKLWQ